ncbi:MAG: hypothetical protein IJ794_01625 [Lachnospiraceae bacterium]|nr:hypothetical protein [Lachnospiraceae bacterium]
MNMDWILKCIADYEILVEFDNIESKEERQEVHGFEEQTNLRCMFCGKPFKNWGKKDVAHAISECLGNKKLINLAECYECNHLFGEIAENHLGKFIMPYRIVNEVYGKGKYKNVIKDMPRDKNLSYEKYRYEQRKNVPVFSSETIDVYNMLIERAGTGRLKRTENGIRLSIPRQNYEPRLVYVSLLKIAYTLLPCNELAHYIKGLLAIYLNMSNKPYYDEKGKAITEALTEVDRQKYIQGLPDLGMEITISSKSIPNGVNVCLLKRIKKEKIEPKLLLAIQMKWHTIVIPILSDNYVAGETCNFNLNSIDNITFRKLCFSKIEEEFICDMSADVIEIPKELYKQLEEDLKNSCLLRKDE